jgi:hypothetical protein
MRLEEATRQRLRDYLSSLSRSVERASGLYEEWFLADREIRQMRGLHISDKVMKSSVTYADKILRTRTKLAELRFYPTKDYLDLCRGQISGDCIDTVLSEQQLARPEFFNIRVFSEGQWIGNIYMLDFTGEQSILLIDRIQIPRQLKVPYLDFFEQLTQALREMFEALPYECILAPLAISNHATIQKAFNTYRKKLRKHEVQLPCTHARYFDSLRTGSGYYALCQKEGISQSFR